MAEKKPSSREQVKQITAKIEGRVQELFQSEQYLEYLHTMARFHNYSVNNTIMIHMQMPHATHVAGFNKWKNKFGRHVKKGEKGLTILAPTPYKKRIEEMKLDPETKVPMRDKGGNIITEEKVVEIPLFRPVKVFDVSQTEGQPLPSLTASLTGDVEQYEVFMEALRRTSPAPIEIKPLRENLDGIFSPKTNMIALQDGMSQVQTVCAAVHEITHAILHNREKVRLSAVAGTEQAEKIKPKDHNTEEVEAESVSYTVCQYYGIETSANSLGYIATWSKDKTLPELKASLETISKTANILITSIDRHFQEICKEQGIDLTARQAEQDAPAADLPSDTPKRFISDMLDMLDRLYQAGIIQKNFSPDNRDQTKANLVRTLQVNPSVVRAALEQFVQQDTGAAEARAMLNRLGELAQGQPPEYEYAVGDGGGRGQFLLMAYRKMDNASKLDRTMFVGDKAACNALLERLNAGTLHFEDFRVMRAARVSRYVTKDGAELDALVDENDKIYLGRRDCYDNHGHYINDGKSLLYLSDNEQMFDFISGLNYADTQTELLAQGCFTIDDYAEFDTLRRGVLAQFKETEPMLFAGEPFSFIQSDVAGLEQLSPEPPEQATVTKMQDKQESRLDEYPLPDPSFPADELEQNYGYAGGDLLPLSRDRAKKLLEQDLTVYMVEAGENPAMVFDRDDLMEQPEGMMFAVSREEWEESQDFRQAVLDRMQHQPEREKAFLDHAADCFAIYQVRDDDALRDIRFESLDWLKSKGRAVERDNYDLVYTAPLSTFASADAALDQLWYQFNNDHPADFQHPSVSVSDIIVLKRDGVVSCHYCDSFGFEQLTDFISQKPTVAELEAQVKAGQTISLTDLADAVHREKKKSVVAQLKNQPAQERKKTAPKKSAEKER